MERFSMRIIRLRIFSLFLIFFLLIIIPLSSPADDTPLKVGGFELGTAISSYQGIVESSYLKDIMVSDWHGFRRGVISYGTCMYKGEILKIAMKYQDKSKQFYKKLLAKFKTKFGDPDTWKGDSFGVLYIWKWHFIDKNQNRVSLSLQFNAKDSDETIGSMVKLSYPEKIKKERLCFIHTRDKNKQRTDKIKKHELNKSDWQYLIPR